MSTGLFYQGDIWLDGSYLGDTEGYFAPHVFEVTEQLESTRDHVLAIEATCWIAKDLTAKRNITGILQHWDNIDPALNPGGLWRTVRIEETGPVRIETLRVTVAEADAGRAIVQFHATLDTVATHTVTVRTLIDQAGDTEGHGEVAVSEEGHLLSTGRNVLEWRIAVENPQLWWPHSLGEQPLYDIRVEVMLAGAASHVRKRKNWSTAGRTQELDREHQRRAAVSEGNELWPRLDRSGLSDGRGPSARSHTCQGCKPRSGTGSRPRHPTRVLSRGR